MSGHITITVNGTDYPLVVDPTSYSEVDIVDFAPRAVSGTPAFSELGLYLDIGQANFGHGFGRWIFEEQQSYGYTGQQVDTRFGHISLYTNYEVFSASTTQTIKRVLVYNNTVLFVTGNGAVAALNAANTGFISLGLAQSEDMFSAGTYLFNSRSSGNRMRLVDIGKATSGGVSSLNDTTKAWATNIWAGGSVFIFEGTGAGQTQSVSSNSGSQLTTGSWSTQPDATSRYVVYVNAGVGGNPPNNFAKIEAFGGYYWAYEKGTAYLHFWSEITASDAEGGGAADAGAVQVGSLGSAIVNIIAFNNQLWVFKQEGAWVVGEDNLAYHTLNFADQVSPLNFLGVAVWNGFLVFNVKNQIFKYRSGLQDITPPFWNELPPYKQYGAWTSMFVRGNFLYLVGRSNAANSDEATQTVSGFASLLATDGVGWHKLFDFPGGASTNQSLAFDPVNDYIYLQATTTTNPGWLRIKLQDLSELPHNSYPTTGDHNWYSSYFDLGMKRIPKSFASLTLSGEFPTNTSVVAYYRVDATTSWTLIGTFNTDLQEIDLPAATTGKKIQFKLNLQTSTSSSTPIVRALVVKVMIRPDVLYGVTTDVLISNDLSDQNQLQLGLTASQIRAALKAARNSVAPITLTDLYGVSASAYLSSIRFLVEQYEDSNAVEARARCTFVYV